MADLYSNTTSDLFAVLGQDSGAQRKQIAQYAIIQAATFMQNNQNDEAIGAFKKALAFDPQSAVAYNYIGQINLSQGKNADAIKAYQQLVRIQSNQTLVDISSNAPTQVQAHISLGNAYLQDKQYASSEKEFLTAAKLDPRNPLPPYTLGLQYANTDRLPEAETQFLKVKQLSPNDGNVYYALGMVYNKQGRSDEAAANLEKALSLKKNFPSANYELGVAYSALGRTEDAQAQLSILQKSDPYQAQNLKALITKPGIISMDSTKSGGFSSMLGPGTPLWMLDPTLLTKPNSAKTFSVTIQFNSAMDAASITNTQNWSISRANSTDAGYYNNTMPQSPKDAVLPNNPLAVIFNSYTHEATVQFRINQNAKGDAVIDPSHVVFKFSGKDASGNDMDLTADEIDGFSSTPF